MEKKPKTYLTYDVLLLLALLLYAVWICRSEETSINNASLHFIWSLHFKIYVDTPLLDRNCYHCLIPSGEWHQHCQCCFSFGMEKRRSLCLWANATFSLGEYPMLLCFLTMSGLAKHKETKPTFFQLSQHWLLFQHSLLWLSIHSTRNKAKEVSVGKDAVFGKTGASLTGQKLSDIRPLAHWAAGFPQIWNLSWGTIICYSDHPGNMSRWLRTSTFTCLPFSGFDEDEWFWRDGSPAYRLQQPRCLVTHPHCIGNDCGGEKHLSDSWQEAGNPVCEMSLSLQEMGRCLLIMYAWRWPSAFTSISPVWGIEADAWLLRVMHAWMATCCVAHIFHSDPQSHLAAGNMSIILGLQLIISQH